MPLVLHKHAVAEVGIGTGSGFQQGRLTIDREALVSYVRSQVSRVTDVRVGIARPGEATRIVCVKDVIQPRVKKEGAEAGDGILCVLENVAVVTCGPIVGFQEGIIDMSGPGAEHTPFSQFPLIVLEIDVVEGLDPHLHEEAVREAGLAAAGFVAEVCRDTEPDEIEMVALTEISTEADLPRIAYVYPVLCQGLLHDTYVFGRNAKEGLPITVAPEVVMDNGVVSGNCVSACDKNTTYHHQNNPVIAELLRGHGSRWNFVGIVLTPAPTRLAEKENAAKAAIEQVVQLKAEGAIVSKEGFGNPDADMMMIVRGLEQAGIRTVGLTDEFAGTDGGSQSLADTTPEADAIVSTGNANERIELPAMKTIFGPLPDVTRLAGGYPHSLRDDGTMEVELQAIIGSTNELGFGRLTCREV